MEERYREIPGSIPGYSFCETKNSLIKQLIYFFRKKYIPYNGEEILFKKKGKNEMNGFIIYLAKTCAISAASMIGCIGGLLLIAEVDKAIENRKSKNSEKIN